MSMAHQLRAPNLVRERAEALHEFGGGGPSHDGHRSQNQVMIKQGAAQGAESGGVLSQGKA